MSVEVVGGDLLYYRTLTFRKVVRKGSSFFFVCGVRTNDAVPVTLVVTCVPKRRHRHQLFETQRYKATSSVPCAGGHGMTYEGAIADLDSKTDDDGNVL